MTLLRDYRKPEEKAPRRRRPVRRRPSLADLLELRAEAREAQVEEYARAVDDRIREALAQRDKQGFEHFQRGVV